MAQIYQDESYERLKQLAACAATRDAVSDLDSQWVFALICFHAIDWQLGANVNSVPYIARHFEWTRYRVRKAIKYLRELGLVERTTCGIPAVCYETESGFEMWDYAHPPVNGFGLSTKGYESATYKLSYDLEDHLLSNICKI